MFFCRKESNFKKKCKFYKKLKVENSRHKSNARNNKANMVKHDAAEIIAMVTNLKN